MGFKRKRSSDDSPISISSFGGFVSTPNSLSPTPLPDHGMAMDLDSTSTSTSGPAGRFNFDFGKRSWGLPVTRVEGSDMGSRTRKRFRDNRPDEVSVHQKTMHLLFSAQRNASPSPQPSITAPTPEPSLSLLPAKPQKSTLHTFWNLPAPPVAIQPSAPVASSTFPPTQFPHCEDCDAPLHPESGMDMDVDMDVEMNGGGSSRVGKEFACNDCGKSVCGTCAVVSRTRHCLSCATKGRHSRRWW